MILYDFISAALLLPLFITVLVVIYNYFTAPKLEFRKSEIKELPLVSILIPARNEEKNIEACIKSAAAQSYKNCEIIILDDNSTDKTNEIAKKYIRENIKLINGEKLPAGWLGKNWACRQLANNSNSDLLLFIDADVVIHENTVETAVNLFIENKVQMLSVFPKQINNSFWTELIVPLLNWLLLSFLPLRKVLNSSRESFSAAIGQFILIDKQAYEKIGGHEFVKNKVVEDLEIARELKRNKYRVMAALGSNLVECKMYDNIKSAIHGFSKNFYLGFNIKPLTYLLFLTFIITIFLLPYILVFFDERYFVNIIIIIIGRYFVAELSGQKILINILLHPLQMFFLFFTGINSLLVTVNNRIEWKQRKIELKKL